MLSMETDLAMLDQLNADYIRAVKDCDARAFEALLAEDFLNSNPDGSLVDRAGFLAQIARPSSISDRGGRSLHRYLGAARRALALRRGARHTRLVAR
jgi:hypothetical protein